MIYIQLEKELIADKARVVESYTPSSMKFLQNCFLCTDSFYDILEQLLAAMHASFTLAISTVMIVSIKPMTGSGMLL